MLENELVTIVLDAAFLIHRKMGPGLLESAYEEILFFELANRQGLEVKKQYPIPLIWEGVRLELGFRADLIVNDKLLVELKSVETLAPVHMKQVLTYLKLTGLKLGLLINFNEATLRHGIKRVANNL